MLNKIRDLLQNKANKPSRRARQPLDREGAEGDFVLTRLKDGVFIFFKGMGKWLKIFHSRTHLIPDKTKSYDLGSHTRRWKNLYLSNNAINIGDTKDTSGKITYDGTDLIFKNKAGTERKVVGKKSSSTAGDTNAENTITLGDESGSATYGQLYLGAGNSHYGGFLTGCSNVTSLVESDYLGVRVLAQNGKGLSIVPTAGVTQPCVYLAAHNVGGGHIALREVNDDPTAVDNYGLIYVDEDDHKLYYRHNELNTGTRVELGGGGGGGGGGHTIQNNSSNLSARANLNFDGTYLVATDDSGNDQTDITINGADGGFDGDVMQIGTALTGLNSNSASTTVRGALQSIDAILALLAPAKPSDLSALSLSYYSTTTYTAKQSSTGNTITNQVTTDTTPRFYVYNFYNGDSGTVSTFRDSTAGGTKVLSTSSDVTSGITANNIKLVISADEDPHAGTAGSEGFYKQLDARIEQTSALSSQSAPYVFKIAHSETGSSGITKNIYIDALANGATPSISSISLGTVNIANSGNGTFRSGVPYMEQSDDFDVTFTVSNAISHFYPSGNIASAYISGVTETVSNTTTGIKTNGDTFSASMSNIDINNNEFVKSPNITCVGYNASGTSGSGTLATTFNIDSKSGVESNFRVRAGGGGNYPTRGTGADQWGEFYSSTQLLTSTNYNEELQYSNGYFHYPTATDYSGLTPAGPDYSGIGTSNIRWMCQEMGDISSASSVTIQFNNDSGFDNNPLQSSDSFELFIKVVDSSDETSDVTGWLDLNASFSSGSPSSNGDACLDYANSDIDTKKCTFGATARTGKVFVRVGWINGGTDPTSSSTRRFTSISMS